MRATAVAVSLVASVSAFAQVARNGDEYGGKNHQPTQAEVARRERSVGVAPSPTQAGKDTRSVEQLDKQLMQTEQASPPRPVGQPSVPPAAR